ncbi:hypothetical protein RchiOBHm_Chr4g0433051 [Rosa chinensis]|uniref:Uncharacterized protein n=1 Tax=Rosa chinensis TaxID=74649 RepID=A0A2P6R1B3_ROSCH|nr:hypothetical protein RchiOBHm_Chr4g0433051 [Rosa chinensis]
MRSPTPLPHSVSYNSLSLSLSLSLFFTSFSLSPSLFTLLPPFLTLYSTSFTVCMSWHSRHHHRTIFSLPRKQLRRHTTHMKRCPDLFSSILMTFLKIWVCQFMYVQ